MRGNCPHRHATPHGSYIWLPPLLLDACPLPLTHTFTVPNTNLTHGHRLDGAPTAGPLPAPLGFILRCHLFCLFPPTPPRILPILITFGCCGGALFAYRAAAHPTAGGIQLDHRTWLRGLVRTGGRVVWTFPGNGGRAAGEPQPPDGRDAGFADVGAAPALVVRWAAAPACHPRRRCLTTDAAFRATTCALPAYPAAPLRIRSPRAPSTDHRRSADITCLEIPCRT